MQRISADRVKTYCVREVSVKYKTIARLPEAPNFHNSREIYQLFREDMNASRVETFKTILLNSKNKVIAVDPISVGSLSTSVVHPREVFTNAVRFQASVMILMHNHPSGDPAPSREDRECTMRLCEASKLLGIRILDHVIFGFEDYYSFADSGTLADSAASPIAF